MKMSDVFDLPIEFAGISFDDQSGRHVAGLDYHTDIALVHAANCHDELVEALEDLIDDISIDHHISLKNMIGGSTRESLSRCHRILNKAKGLDK